MAQKTTIKQDSQPKQKNMRLKGNYRHTHATGVKGEDEWKS